MVRGCAGFPVTVLTVGINETLALRAYTTGGSLNSHNSHVKKNNQQTNKTTTKDNQTTVNDNHNHNHKTGLK